MSKHLLIVSLVGVASLSACGGVGSTVPIEDLPEELDEARCESAVECGESPSLDVCLATSFTERGEELKTLAAAIEAGTIEYHSDLAADCLDFFRNYDCTVAGAQELIDAINNVCE